MGKYRKRFNEKARTGMLAKQAALKKARNKQFTRHLEDGNEDDTPSQPEVEQDPNADILKPMTEEEKEERKKRLVEDLYTENSKETKMSRSKRKRLDKYIEHQIKREEKKVLLEKLSQTKVDTSIFAPSKLLGTGKQTRKEEMIEALELERQGRGDERTKEILYEEREVKEWSGDENEAASQFSGDEDESDYDDESAPKSTFVDYRPQGSGGFASGFGFGNLTKKTKTAPKKKYTWRLKVEREEKKRAKLEDDNDFVLSEEEEDDGTSAADAAELAEHDSSNSEIEEDEVHAQDSSAELEEEQSQQEMVDEDEEQDDDSEDDDEENSNEDSEEESDDDSEDESDGEEEDQPRLLQNKPKHSKVAESFKEWAEEQVRKLEGRTEMVLEELTPELKEKYAKGVHDDKLVSDDETAIPINTELQREAFFVHVERSEEIQKQRMQLPVFSEEHRIMEAIHHHDCIVLCGETGSGKTTQVPQFLYESGFGNVKSDLYPGMIGITQPRRVAAVSMANRVGAELGDHGKRVAHQIRFDTTVKNEGTEDGTAMKFMTDGVLLREMMNDFLLTKYSALIIDEAHERNINTDILIGMLSRAVKLRREKSKPLKLIIMSATLRVSDFSENKQLFKLAPPILKVEARQYPVSVHFDKKTKFDYVEQAFKKTCKIHKRLPPGGILIFLTGQNEITTLVKKLRNEFPFNTRKKQYVEDENVQYRVSNNVAMEAEDVDLDIALRERKEEELEGGSESESDSDEEEGFEETLEDHQSESDPLYVLPLYSLLPTAQQMKVFENPPEGSRMCIVATNVAETSLTIPGIRYVVDCGRSKERKLNEETGVQSFEVDWISKASAGQRAGRAGRTGPGHCYRLFSSAIYEEFFEQFSKPEILRMPVESTVLTMKSMGIHQIINFPFPTPPDRRALAKAERLLVTLGALEKKEKTITDLGKTMAFFPLSPRFAKILIVGNQIECLPYVIAIVSALSVGDPFLDEYDLGVNEEKKQSTGAESASEEEEEDEMEVQAEVERKRRVRTKFYKSRAMFSRLDEKSDALRLLSAVCAFDHVPKDKKQKFLEDHFLRSKLMEEIQKLRKQINHIVQTNARKDTIAQQDRKEAKLGVPSKQQISALKQIITSGFIDQVAIRTDVIDADYKLSKKASITAVPYSVVNPIAQYGDNVDPHVYIHPSSILSSNGLAPPQYIVFQSVNKGSNQKDNRMVKLRIKPLVDISGKQLANVAKSSGLISYSKPLGNPYGPKEITPTKRECYVVPRYGSDIGDGGIGWELPVIKVIQNKKFGSWVTEE